MPIAPAPAVSFNRFFQKCSPSLPFSRPRLDFRRDFGKNPLHLAATKKHSRYEDSDVEQADEPSQKRHRREVVLEELAKFLRRRNEPDRKRWPFLDRPIVLTLITTLVGGGIVGGATTWWQVLEKRRIAETEYQRALVNTKFALLRTFAAAYQRSGNVLNSWLLHVLWIAEEKDKSQIQIDARKIRSWASEVSRLQDEYSKAEAVDGVLVQIEGVFSSEVRATAQTMKKKWESFEELMREVNRRYNVSESMTSQDIVQLGNLRKASLQELEGLKNKLLTEMGDEIRGTSR